MALLPPEHRSRFARSAAALLGMPQLCAVVSTEVEATFAENPMLPRTEEARRVLWGLALPHLFNGAPAPSAESKPA